MIEQALRVGSFANIPVRIHWTFAFIILYVIVTGFSEGSGLQEIFIQLCFTLSIFVCVVLHEFGHALSAARFGIKTEDIILLPIGGVARLQNFPDKPKQELIIAIMGPVVNLIIATTVFIILKLSYSAEEWESLFQLENFIHLEWSGFLPLLIIANVMLLLFNMIPAFPMDGGRVLRALISMRTNRLVATRWATRIGQIICILFIGLGLYFNAWTTILIGVFIFFSAGQEYKQVAKDFAFKNKTIHGFFRAITICLTDFQKCADAKQMVLQSGLNNLPVIDLSGHYLGSVRAKDVIDQAIKNPDLLIRDIMTQGASSINLNEPLIKASSMLDSGFPLIFVHDSFQIVGVIDQESIHRGLMFGQ